MEKEKNAVKPWQNAFLLLEFLFYINWRAFNNLFIKYIFYTIFVQHEKENRIAMNWLSISKFFFIFRIQLFGIILDIVSLVPMVFDQESS